MQKSRERILGGVAAASYAALKHAAEEKESKIKKCQLGPNPMDSISQEVQCQWFQSRRILILEWSDFTMVAVLKDSIVMDRKSQCKSISLYCSKRRKSNKGLRCYCDKYAFELHSTLSSLLINYILINEHMKGQH
uniref:Uncharacterized protein n=1 Tax=Glossina palpalis gambiensis TaxID=67801 RepID=A0A1B0BJY5_9MUSC